MTTPNDKEKVLAVGFEGGGYEVYRQHGINGNWEYVTEGTYMAMDENDDEIWREYSVGPYADLATLLLNLRGTELLIAHPIEAHPDIRETLNEIVEEIAEIYNDASPRDPYIRNLNEWREVCDKGYVEDWAFYSKYWPGYKEFQQRKKSRHLQS